MTQEEIYGYLCYKDKRNSNFMLSCEPEDNPEPRNNCYCDNCFRGKDELALEILRLREELGVQDVANI